MHTFTPKPGTSLQDACAEAALLANLNRHQVRLIHGGIELDAQPGTTGWKLEQEYHAATARSKARLLYAE